MTDVMKRRLTCYFLVSGNVLTKSSAIDLSTQSVDINVYTISLINDI